MKDIEAWISKFLNIEDLSSSNPIQISLSTSNSVCDWLALPSAYPRLSILPIPTPSSPLHSHLLLTSRPVWQTVVDTISWQLFGRSLGQDKVTLDFCVDDLYSDELVWETDYQSVLWSIVLVLCLSDQLSTSKVIGFTFSSSSVLCLVTREVSARLDLLDEWLERRNEKWRVEVEVGGWSWGLSWRDGCVAIDTKLDLKLMELKDEIVNVLRIRGWR